jgi:hypothetical protein
MVRAKGVLKNSGKYDSRSVPPSRDHKAHASRLNHHPLRPRGFPSMSSNRHGLIDCT